MRAVLSAGTGTASAVSPSRPVTRLGTTAPTAGSARVYPNCAALNAFYPYGVGRPGAADHTSGTPVTTFLRAAATYPAQPEPDRDHDGIACEKR